jgi:hypothetical protein
MWWRFFQLCFSKFEDIFLEKKGIYIKNILFYLYFFHLCKFSCRIKVELLRKMHSFLIYYNMQLFLFVVITLSILTKANKRFHANLTNKRPKSTSTQNKDVKLVNVTFFFIFHLRVKNQKKYFDFHFKTSFSLTMPFLGETVCVFDHALCMSNGLWKLKSNQV